MTTLAAETGDFAKELYDLLRVLDRTPGEDAFAGLRSRIDRLLQKCRAIVANALQDEAISAIVRALEAILAALEDLREQLVDGWSAAAFKRFRSAAAPHYEALAARLRAMRVETPTLRPQNLTRSAYHVANGLFAAACIEFLPTWTWVRVLSGAFFFFAITNEIGRRRVPGWNKRIMGLFKHVAHPSEEFRINSATFYATALFSLALFSSAIPCLMAVLALGVGDPAAAFFGRRWGKIRIHAGRSLEGSTAFAVTAFVACFVGVSLFHPGVALGTRVALAVASGVVGAVVELYSGRIDDNFSIPIGVAAAASLVMAIAG